MRRLSSYFIGCTGAVAAQSRLGGGDDINVRRWMSEVDYTDRPEMMRVAVAKIAPRWGATGWPQGIAGLATAERDLFGDRGAFLEVARLHPEHPYAPEALLLASELALGKPAE